MGSVLLRSANVLGEVGAVLGVLEGFEMGKQEVLKRLRPGVMNGHEGQNQSMER